MATVGVVLVGLSRLVELAWTWWLVELLLELARAPPPQSTSFAALAASHQVLVVLALVAFALVVAVVLDAEQQRFPMRLL